VLQVGADIYCDTALICDVLEHVRPEPPLYPPHLKGVCRIFAQWADSTLFWAAMAYNLQPKGAPACSPRRRRKRQAFGEDRKAMSGNMTRLRPGDATSAYRSYLRRIANMADEHDFLFGMEPCVADFAAYHGIWYTRNQVPVLADILQRHALGARSGWTAWPRSATASRPTDDRRRRDHRRQGGRAACRRASQPADRQRLPGRPRHRAGHRVTITAESFGNEPPKAT
jgi:glutathione S-transferase